MAHAAAIVLAGGRSSRMGVGKADLEWHGSTLLYRTAALVARAVDGPVIVVRAPGQRLPALPDGVEIVDDEREGRGPLQGIASGLAAAAGRAEVAYISCTDAPLLHPAFVAHVLRALDAEHDVALPRTDDHSHTLAAAYRTALGAVASDLVAAGETRPRVLLERCRVRTLDAAQLLADPAVAACDPCLDSLANVNTPADYAAVRARPAPTVTLRAAGTQMTVHAATLAAAALAAGVALDGMVVELNDAPVAAAAQLPLATGDIVALGPARPR